MMWGFYSMSANSANNAIQTQHGRACPGFLKFGAGNTAQANKKPDYSGLYDNPMLPAASKKVSPSPSYMEVLGHAGKQMLDFWESVKECLIPGYRYNALNERSEIWFFPQLQEQEAFTHSPASQAIQTTSTSLGRPLAGTHPERRLIGFTDEHANLWALREFGDLAKRCVLWLQDKQDDVKATLMRDERSQPFGKRVPNWFYPLELKISPSVTSAIARAEITKALLSEAAATAKKEGFRIAIKASSRDCETFYQECGLIPIQQAVKAYVPSNITNDLQPGQHQYWAFDGTLAPNHRRD